MSPPRPTREDLREILDDKLRSEGFATEITEKGIKVYLNNRRLSKHEVLHAVPEAEPFLSVTKDGAVLIDLE